MLKSKNYNIKILCTILSLFLIMTLLLTSCKNKESDESLSDIDEQRKTSDIFPIEIEDQMGRKNIIKKIPERIISLSPSNTEILYVLGLEDKLVGVTDYCDYPETAKSKEKVGGYDKPNIEKIISLEPDLVLATSAHQKPVEQMEKFDIPSIVIEPDNIDEMLESVMLIGKATGSAEYSKKIVLKLKQRLKRVDEKVANISDEERPKVYYELWHTPIMTVGPGTFVNDIINRAGGENIASDANKDYPQYSQEEILAKDPDIIIFSYHGKSQQSKDDILERPGWENINAIKNNNVYCVDEDILLRPTPRLIDGLERIAEVIHPEIFKKD